MLVFFSKGLEVWDEVEVAEAFLALTSELDGHHQSNLVVACCILCVDKRVVMREVHFVMEEIGRAQERLRDVVEHVGHILVDADAIELAVDPFPILGECW